MKRDFRFALFAQCAFLMLAPDIHAQSFVPDTAMVRCERTFGPLTTLNVDHFPQYSPRRMTPDTLRNFRQRLKDSCWEHALRLLFPESRRPQLVDWVVFIDSAGRVTQGVTKNQRVQHELRQEKYVWGIVFSDMALAGVDSTKGGGSAGTDSASAQSSQMLEFRRRSINYQRDPLLSALVKSLASKFFTSVDVAESPVVADSSISKELTQLSADTTVARMYTTQVRFGVSENTEAEFSVRPATAGMRFPGRVASAYNNVGNASASLFELGVAIGTSIGPRTEVVKDDTLVTGTRAGIQPNVFLTGYVNLIRRPSLPWRPRSLGLVTGMNVARGDVFDDVLLGIAGGRLIYDAGLVVAADAQRVTEIERSTAGTARGAERRKIALVVAVDLRF